MIHLTKMAACAAAVAALAGCGTTTIVDSGAASSANVGDGLSGTQAQFDRMILHPGIAMAAGNVAGQARTDRAIGWVECFSS